MKKEKIEDNKKKEIDMKQTEKENKKINKEKIKDMANKYFIIFKNNLFLSKYHICSRNN